MKRSSCRTFTVGLQELLLLLVVFLREALAAVAAKALGGPLLLPHVLSFCCGVSQWPSVCFQECPPPVRRNALLFFLLFFFHNIPKVSLNSSVINVWPESEERAVSSRWPWAAEPLPLIFPDPHLPPKQPRLSAQGEVISTFLHPETIAPPTGRSSLFSSAVVFGASGSKWKQLIGSFG